MISQHLALSREGFFLILLTRQINLIYCCSDRTIPLRGKGRVKVFQDAPNQMEASSDEDVDAIGIS